MSILLSEMEGFAYLGDILMFSETPEEHFDQIKQVLDRLRGNRLKSKLPKCHFLREETRFLCFCLNKDAVNPDMDKVEVIRQVRGPIGANRLLQKFHPSILKTGKHLDSID